MPNVGSRPPSSHEELDDLDIRSSKGSGTGSVSQGTHGRSAFTAPPRFQNSGAFVHGTKYCNWQSIMDRGLVAKKSEIFMIDEVRQDGRVPGLQKAPEILIFIDEDKARSENMEFTYDAEEGTWKTTGIQGVIRPWFFQKVVDQRNGPGKRIVLFQSKEDPIMKANTLHSSQKPKYLLHATYWENVNGILNQGILPAKNPTSDSRRPFRDLLQGAESHVYTTRTGDSTSSRPRSYSNPEASPTKEKAKNFKLNNNSVGLEKRPDAFFVIDTEKAEQMGYNLELVQSDTHRDHVFVKGKVPVEALAAVQPHDALNLPESLKANIVDPKSFEDIPIIDLRQDEAVLIEQLRYACEDVGFMQVVGHGVCEDLQRRHMELQEKFFKLPQQLKERLRLCEESPVRGYFGVGGEDLDSVVETKVDAANNKDVISKSRKDLKEALDTNGVPWSRPHGGYIAEIFAQPSCLPEEDELAEFKDVLERYASEMFRVSRRLLEIMALILEKPRDFFEQHLTNPVATHRLLHYWPIKDFETQIGVGAHTDYGLLTVLKQDMTGGLQVLNAKDGKWVHCCPTENAFVVNLGDMIGRWTAHRFKSTVHRVVTTSASERYSVPYFLEPNMDTVIKYGGLCDGPGLQGSCEMHLGGATSAESELQPRVAEETAEAILERFYRASGQLKFHAKPAGAAGGGYN